MKIMQGDTEICFTEVRIHHVHHVLILVSVEEAYRDHKVKLSPPFHYMTMCPRATRSLLQQTCRCSPQAWELAGDA